MSNMFWASRFNGDISGWDVSAVTNMHHMFVDSVFNGDISGWDVSNVRDMSYMFNCRFERFDGDLSRWDVSNVRDMTGMFAGASFEGDLSSWLVSPDCNTEDMFDDSFPEDLKPKVAAPLETLSVDSIPVDYDLDSKMLQVITDYLNKQDLDWVKSNEEIVRKLLVSHSHLRDLLAEGPLELEVPEFSLESVDRDTCVLLSMFFEAYGVSGYDPDRLDDAALGGMTELRTLALGHESLFQSVHKSFCLHFDVLSEVSLGGPPSFSEMDDPYLINAKIFVEEILRDPDASFNQR
jgi:surface protein